MNDDASIDDWFISRINDMENAVMREPIEHFLLMDLREYKEYLYGLAQFPENIIDDSKYPSVKKDRSLKLNPDTRELEEHLEAHILFELIVDTEIAVTLLKRLKPSLEGANGGQLYCEDYHIHSKLPIDEINNDNAENQIINEIDRIKEGIKERQDKVKKNNENLKKAISDFVDKKYYKIKNLHNVLEQVSKKVPVILIEDKEKSSEIANIIRMKKELQCLIKPTPKNIEHLYLTRDEFNAIMNLIDNSCRLFEISPGTYNKLTENDLRNIILSNLNSVFKGRAVGEAFAVKGKTDILINVKQNGVFKAECKYWRDRISINEPVSQMLGYLNWRDTYGVIIIFNKKQEYNQNISEVVTKVKNKIMKSKNYIPDSLKENGKGHFIALYALKGDGGVPIEIHYLIYDLCT